MLTRLQTLLATTFAAGILVAAPVAARAEMEMDRESESTMVDREDGNRDLDDGMTKMEMDRNDSDMDGMEMESRAMDSIEMRDEMDDMDSMSREQEFSSTPVRGLW